MWLVACGTCGTCGTLIGMADEEPFSHVIRLGGLRPLVLDRYAASEAAVNCTGPPTEHATIKPFVRYFLEFLRNGPERDTADKELRRQVLLMVTRDRSKIAAGERDAAKIARTVQDIYQSIA